MFCIRNSRRRRRASSAGGARNSPWRGRVAASSAPSRQTLRGDAGYPAHEWTRPFSGYVPPRFEDWAVPKGFFLILRHHPGLDGWAFLEALTAAMAKDPILRDYNATQQALWRAHSGDFPWPVLNGIPCLVNEDQRSRVPFTLVSEIPDETIHGEASRFA